MKILGLDIGEKRIGIALSDEMKLIAHGFSVLERRNLEDDINMIKTLVESEGICEIVVGIPKNMNGSLGESAQKVISFVRKIEELIPIDVIFWDERFTTMEATKILLEADLGRKKRRKVVDKLAAILILQGYLDSQTTMEEREEKP